MSDFRHTPVTFTREEARRIREQLDTHDAGVSCPRCDAALEIQGPIAGGGTMGPMFQVRCAPCNRSAIITETRGTRRSAE